MKSASTLEHICRRLQEDFAVDRVDRDFLLHYLQVNLRELRKSLDDCINGENWDTMTWCADFLKGLAANLEIDEMREIGMALAAGAKQRDEQVLARALTRLDALLAQLKD